MRVTFSKLILYAISATGFAQLNVAQAQDSITQEHVAVTLRAKILDASGVPQAGMEVQLRSAEGWLIKSVRANNDGGLVIDDVPLGDYRLICVTNFFERNVAIPLHLNAKNDSESSPFPRTQVNIGDGTKVLIGTIGSLASAITPLPYKIAVILVVGAVQYSLLQPHLRIDFQPEPSDVRLVEGANAARRGDILQEMLFNIKSCDAPLCSDPNNPATTENPLKCLWWRAVITPKSRNSSLKVSVTLTSDITVAAGPWTGGCTGDPSTTDRWRRGNVIVRCGRQIDSRDEQFNGEGDRTPKNTHFYSKTLSCDTNNEPVDIGVFANPRPCSAMKLIEGLVTVQEIKK